MEMGKMKIARVCLLCMIVICCFILIIPSVCMIKTLTRNGELLYENITGELVGYIFKTNYAGVKTNYEMFAAMSRFQAIVLVVNALLAAVLILGELKEKRIILFWLLLLIVSLFEINLLGSSTIFMILSFIPAALAIIYKMLGGNRTRKKQKANPEKK